MRKQQCLAFPCSHLEGLGCCHSMVWLNACLQHRIRDLQTEPLWDSFLHFCIILAPVITKMLFQRAEKMNVTWYQDPTWPSRWQPCCSTLNGNAWDRAVKLWSGRKWLPLFRLSEEASLWSQIPECCRKLSYSGSVHKAHSSMLGANF